MSWSTVRFEELYAEPSRNGVYKQKQFHGSGVRIVNMGELFAYDVIADQEMKRLAMTDTEMARSGLANGDLLFGRRSLVESGAGKCSLVEGLSEPTTFESSIIRVRLDEDRLRPRFVYYWLKSHGGRGTIRAIVTGTNVKGIRASVLKNVQVVCPPTTTQDLIVEKLRAYDDLIENNRQRIQLLERAARLLYKEWFVHLRFPGHEHVTITDGVPEGWTEGVVSDFYSTGSGGTPSRKILDFYTGEIPWVKTQELTGSFILSTEERITHEAVKRSSARLFPRHTVLIAMYGATIGQTAILSIPSTTNQACCAVISREPGTSYVHASLFFRHHKTDLVGLGQGAAQNNVSQQVIKSFRMVLPRKEALQSFSESVFPLFDQIETLEKANINLAEARDLLLPRLMNGELSV